MKELVTYILSGIPLTIPSIFYYHDHNHYELSLVCSVGIFFGIHVMLAVIAVLDSGCEKNAINVHSSKVEEQIEKRGQNVVPVTGLGVEEPVENRRETAMPVPGAEAQEEGCEKTVIAKPGLYQEEQKGRCNETVIQVPDSVVEETAMPGPVSDEKTEQNEGYPESVISIISGFCANIVR